jgi:hypothetical protein
MFEPAGLISISSGISAASQTSSSSWRTAFSTPPRLMPRRFLFAGEADRHVDGHLAVLGDAQEIDMQRPVGDRVELDVLGKGAGGPPPTSIITTEFMKWPVVQRLDQRLLLEVDRQGSSLLP